MKKLVPMKVVFIEPPKDIWFIMGEYLPPPYGIIQLAAYLEKEIPDIQLRVIDCNASQIDWDILLNLLKEENPDIIASSSLATCNTYEVARTLQTAKKACPEALTVTGGQHFTFTADESLGAYPEIDVIVRGEGEVTLTELVKAWEKKSPLSQVNGISYRDENGIHHTPDRALIGDLDTLPFPGYHFVEDVVHMYNFAAMGGRDAQYALVEGGRGCPHKCNFCTQWRHWCGKWRVKTPARIADEMEYVYNKFGGRFIWLTDDNFGPGERAKALAEELLKRDFGDDFMWFVQMRCDDVLDIKEYLPLMRKSGLQWVMMGVESPNAKTLEEYRKDLEPKMANEAVKLLQANDIFTHAMFIIGDRSDTYESIEALRQYVLDLDPDFVIYTVLTPFPGIEVYDEAKAKGWIEDDNLFHYDMAHAIMGTETLTRKEVQEELHLCYRSFYGSWSRRIRGILSSNALKRRLNWYMAWQGILVQLKNLAEMV